MAGRLYNQSEERTTVHTPLLGDFPRPDEDADPISSTRPRYYVLGLILGIVFVTDLANSVSKAPLMRVFESIICQNHFALVDPNLTSSNGFVEERHCKAAPVQEELALLRGWQDFFDYLPGLFLAIPFGMLADKYGRKWLSVLNVASIWLRMGWICFICAFPHAFPIRLIWLQSALGILGGGSLVASALFMVIMTDVTPESHRANVFFYAHAALCATEFFGPPLGSVLMNRDPWVALRVSILLLALAIPLALALPETLNESRIDSYSLQNRLSLSRPSEATVVSKIMSHLPSLGFLLADHRILFVLLTSISFIFGQACANLVLQYTSRRYGWSLSQAAYLSSVRAAIMIVVLLGLLPLASNYLLNRRSFTSLKKDVLLLRVSFTFVAIGLLVEGLAPNIPLFVAGCCLATIGMGATALVRSLLSTLVQQDEVGRLFAVMSVIWTAAMLLASPVVATLFVEGVEIGGIWSGLPFLFSGLLFAMATGATWVTSLGGLTAAEQEERIREAEELEREKEIFIGPVSWTPRTPSFRVSLHYSPRAATATRTRPSDLMTEANRRPGDGGLLTCHCLETPPFSPRLQTVGPHGRF